VKKHLFIIFGCIAGLVLGNMISTAFWVGGLCGFFGAILGHQLCSYLDYTKASPKSFLAFHGPDSPITKTGSQNELIVAFDRLQKGGLLKGFKPELASALVDEEIWLTLSDSERKTFIQMFCRAVVLDGGEQSSVCIYAGDAGSLHRLWPAEGVAVEMKWVDKLTGKE
jgi:hypothetical protein